MACVAADSFPFSGGAENEKRARKGAHLGWAKKLERSRERVSKPHPLPLLLILPLFRSFPPVRERLEKGRKRLLRRLLVTRNKSYLTFDIINWRKVNKNSTKITSRLSVLCCDSWFGVWLVSLLNPAFTSLSWKFRGLPGKRQKMQVTAPAHVVFS